MAGASRVKGISIELTIDGSKVTKWVQQFRTEAGKAQSSLKDLEKSLKLNPTNANLLGQKFQVLGETIQKTESYLDKLQKSYSDLANKQDPTQKDIEQMRNLQREISDTQVKLEALQKEYRNWGSVSIQQIKAVGEQMQALGKSIQDHGRDIQTLGMEWERIGAPAQAALGFAVKEGMTFEKGMSAVKAVTGATGEEFEKLETAARNMAKQTVFSAGEVAEAEYYMGLAGWNAQESVNGLTGVLDLAAAGQVDLGRASSIVVDGLTAMGMKADEAGHFTNVMAAAMSNSNTTVDLLGESFKYAAPIAGSLNYSIEDLTLGLGLMASAGIKGSQAGTGLRMAMKNLANPTDKQAAAMEKFNITMDDGYGNALSFRDVINQFRDSFGGLNLELTDADGNLKTGEQLMEEYGDSLPTTQMEKFRGVAEIVGVRALPGILGMIQATDDDFNQLANAVDNADSSFVEMNGTIYPLKEALELFGEEAVRTQGRVVGTAEAMRRIQLDNLQGDLTLLKDNLADLGIEIYQTLVPYIRQFVAWVGSLAEKFRNLSPEAQKIITIIGLVVAAIGPALMVIGGIVRGVGTVISTVGSLVSSAASFIGFLTGTVAPALSAFFSFIIANPIVLVIAAIVAAVVLLIQHWDLVKEKAQVVVDFILEKWQAFKDAISELWNAVKEFAVALWQGIKDTFVEAWEQIKTFFFETVEKLQEKWQAFKDKIVEIIENLREKWEAFKDKIVQNVIEPLKQKWEDFKQKIAEIFERIKEKIENLKQKWEDFKQKIADIVEAVKQKIEDMKQRIHEKIEAIKEKIEYLKEKWEDLKQKVIDIKDAIVGKVEDLKSRVETAFESIRKFMEDPIGSAKKFIEEKIQAIKDLFPLSIGKIFSNLKLPHIDWGWKDVAGIVKIPTFSVSWYAKAMKNGMLLDGATIFGAQNGQLLGGGEVGKEWIVGQNSLMSMIQHAVGNNGVSAEGVYNAVIEGMSHAKVDVYMDGKKVTNIIARNIASGQAAQARYYGG